MASSESSAVTHPWGRQRGQCQRRKAAQRKQRGRAHTANANDNGTQLTGLNHGSTGQLKLALGARAREGPRPPLSPGEHSEVGEQVVGEA